MRDDEFKGWLARRSYQGRPITPKGINNRVRKAPRIERALKELGFSERDLDAVHANGLWPDLVEAVRRVAADWRANEAASRKMAPQAPDPTRQLTNLINVARQYGHFADGKDPNYDADSEGEDFDELDEAALELLRQRFLSKFPDFESSGGFSGKSSFHLEEDDYKRPLIAAVGEMLTADTTPREIGKRLLALLLDDNRVNLIGDYRRKDHLKKVRERSGGAFEEAVGALALSRADPPLAAEEFVRRAWPLVLEGSEHSKPYSDIRVLATLPQALARPGEAISVITRRFENLSNALRGRAMFGNDVLSAAEYRDALDLSAELFAAMEDWGWRPRDLWDVQGFIWVACEEKLGMDASSDADRIRQYALDHHITPARERGDLFVTVRAGDVHNALGMVNAHANVCQALRGAKFQDLAEVGAPSQEGPDNSSTTNFTYSLGSMPMTATATVAGADPTNLILYGPPGTGKTYATAAEAVKLCDGLSEADPLLTDPHRRAELKQRYDELRGQSRVDFVTFHQNFSYEDFVEGLRPPSGEEGAGAGLRLDVHHGIFREMVTLAQSGAGRAGPATIDLAGRRFFKMSLGRAGIEDQIYDAAIEGNYIALGWGGQEDWSDPKYDGDAGYDAVFERWNEIDPGTSGNAGNISQTWCFRSSIRKGDIVVVSFGNSHVRAIAEVTGDYHFVLGDPFGYHHHRDVKWLRVFDEPIPASAVYDRSLVQMSCYRLKDSAVKEEGLLSFLGSIDGGSGERLPYVLVIDEINRANISKVFGELITLIEPDKRLGAENALKVKLPYSQDEFGVPSNLHIVGTMNTADRSIALLDTALRRRFLFRELAPDPELLPAELEGVPLRKVLEVINDRIEYLVDREHRIGHAFFIRCSSRAEIDAAMRDKVIPLLQEYFFEDWARVAAVLGERRGKGGAFLDCRVLKDPTGQDGEDRESWRVRESFAADAYDRLIGKAAPDPDPAVAEAKQ